MRSLWRACFLITLIGAVAVPAGAQDITDDQIRNAIRKGVNFLYQQQNGQGHWDRAAYQKPKDKHDHPFTQYGGTTSLCLYALFNAGEDWQGNPKLYNALKWLADQEHKGVYARGFRAHVWPKLPDASADVQFLNELRNDLNVLSKGFSKNNAGTYTYTLGGGGWDHSCTQYGVLGVWEAAKRGLKVEDRYWHAVEQHFLKYQDMPSGGWGYAANKAEQRVPRMSMTAAGLAMLYITQDYLHSNEYIAPGVAHNSTVGRAIDKGLEYFDKHYKPSTNGYLMVGIERVGVASGRKFFNQKDWYRTGAAKLVGSQKGDGSMGGGGYGGTKTVNTAFSVIFLSRGRMPVMINKLAIDGYQWNNRPRDAANVTRWAEREFETPMNWQVVDLDTKPEQWVDAPILYLAGHKPLPFSGPDDPSLLKIKRFIDLGGVLVTNADGGSGTFTASVRKHLESVYPYKFEAVDKDDELFHIVRPVERQRAASMHNGVRHLVVHFPSDPAAHYQVSSGREPDAWHLMGNIFHYAIEKKEPRAKLDRHLEWRRGGKAGPKVAVGRVRHKGNWDPEPLAWDRFAVAAANARKADLKVRVVDAADAASSGAALLHVVGTEAAELTSDQLQALIEHARSGGVVLFEAAGVRPSSPTRSAASCARSSPVRACAACRWARRSTPAPASAATTAPPSITAATTPSASATRAARRSWPSKSTASRASCSAPRTCRPACSAHACGACSVTPSTRPAS